LPSLGCRDPAFFVQGKSRVLLEDHSPKPSERLKVYTEEDPPKDEALFIVKIWFIDYNWITLYL